MADYYERTPEQSYEIYKDRARFLNVLRFFVALLPFTAVVVIFNRWFRLLFEPAADAVNPSAGTNQAVVSVNGNCLLLLGVIFAPFLGAAMLRAIAGENKEMKETKPTHGRREAAHPVETMTGKAAPIMTWQEPEKNPLEEQVREIQERQERIRKKQEERSWRNQERRKGVMKPLLMTWQEYLSKVWTKEEIQAWMRIHGGGWE